MKKDLEDIRNGAGDVRAFRHIDGHINSVEDYSKHPEGCTCGHCGKDHDHKTMGHVPKHTHGDACGCGHDHDHDHDHECCGHDHNHHHHHHADDVFTSWGTETPHKYKKAELEAALKKLSESEEYGIILRAKGMVANEDGTWIYFDLVPGEYELREGNPEYTGRLCVIGTNLDTRKLEELFQLV